MSTQASDLHTAAGAAPHAPRPGQPSGYLASPRGSLVSAAELLREVNEYFAIGAAVRPGDTVVDVGANAGAFALRVAELCDGDVSLVCFEPSPLTFEALCRSFRHNPLLGRTRRSLLQCALTSREKAGAPCRFYHFRRFPTNSTLDLEGKRREFEAFFQSRATRVRHRLGSIVGGIAAWLIAGLPKGPIGRRMSDLLMGLEEVDVQLQTLDDALARDRIDRVDLLKIDVEGHELDVLRGLSPGSWPRIRQVVLETGGLGGDPSEVVALLERNGLSHIRVAPQTAVDNGLANSVILARRP